MRNKYYKLILSFIILPVLFLSCHRDKTDIDENKPEILASGNEASPKNCNVFIKGTFIPVRLIFSDDVELGSFNIEVHNNFDHHTHSTEHEECTLDAKKQPVHPWIYNKDFTIPSKLKSYKVNIDIPIPADIDEGDYHFMIRLTDKSGWQQLRSWSIKISR